MHLEQSLSHLSGSCINTDLYTPPVLLPRLKVWTSERNEGQSIGFMACSGLGASHKLIFRCPCTLTECEEEKRVIDKLLQAGQMPMQDW